MVMDNVEKENFCQIWNGKKFYEFRKMHLEGKRKSCKECSDCKTIFNQIDDIDGYREAILKRLNAKRGESD